MRAVKFHDQFYDTVVHLIVCSPEEFSKKHKQYDISNACGVTIPMADKLVIWMPKLDIKSPDDISTLVHECCHCVFLMAAAKDIPLTQKEPEPNSEVLAYSVDCLVKGLLAKAKKMNLTSS